MTRAAPALALTAPVSIAPVFVAALDPRIAGLRWQNACACVAPQGEHA
ncbi:hypothetical protein [Acidovorax sp. 62]|nr:hypothetical protein [Acidovorax sp. 62]